MARRALLGFAVSITANFAGTTISSSCTLGCNDTHPIGFNESWGAFALVVDADLVWAALVGVDTLLTITCSRVASSISAIFYHPVSVYAD